MPWTRRVVAVIRRVVSHGEPANRALRVGLGGLAVLMSLIALRNLVYGFPWGADLEIPLRAADRWLAGGQPYLAASFSEAAGYNLPFLYPPYVLPLIAPLTAIARLPLHVLWFGTVMAIAVATCRRLGIGWKWIPLLLIWPPFAEGLIVENVQIAIFGAFVLLFYPRGADRPLRPSATERSPVVRGLLAAGTFFLKVSQPHVIVHFLRRERRAGLIAVAAVAILILATLPVTGMTAWFDWIEQLKRASDPAWTVGGLSLSRLLPAPIGTLIVAACLGAVLFVPRTNIGAWLGVLLVVGAPSLHTYYLLFLLPAMLHIRREIGIIAALLIATYTESGWWLGIALVAGTLVASRVNDRLVEPSDRRVAAAVVAAAG